MKKKTAKFSCSDVKKCSHWRPPGPPPTKEKMAGWWINTIVYI